MSRDLHLNMANQDADDFDFDDQGIYREVSENLVNGVQDIHLDEDGIWRDDTDHWSHQTYRTFDSGIAINDHRSSSSTINRLPPVAADLDPVSYSHDSNATDSLLPDEKSLNISELEASESMLGDEISFEQRSFHSDENLDLPELVDDSYLIDSETSKDLHTEYGRDSITDQSEYSASKVSHHGSHDYEHSDDDLGDHRQLPNYRRPDLDLDLELLSRDSDWLISANENTVLEQQDAVPAMIQRKPAEPKIEGDSLFTQEEPNSIFGGQSLAEFEELEAEVQTHLSDGAMENMDLIGAYLQGLTQQEADEDSSSDNNGDDDELVNNNQGKSDKSPTDKRIYSAHSEVGDSSAEHKLANSLDKRMNQSEQRMTLDVHSQEHSLAKAIDQSQKPSDVQPSDNNMLKQDDSLGDSLIENQKPPFDSLPFSSLEISSGLHTDSGLDDQTESGHDSSRYRSKIPILRSRSPSMSRPGSCSPCLRNRSMSPAVSRKQPLQLGTRSQNSSSGSRQGEHSRSLPPTPSDKTQDQARSSSRQDSHRSASAASDHCQDEASGEQNEDEGSLEDLPELSSVGAQIRKSNPDFVQKLSRQSLLQKFKMTSHSQTSVAASRAHPLKATGNEPSETHSSCDETYESEDLSQSSVVTADLKKRFLQEKRDRKDKELTLEQLQKEYNDLLKKHATAENLIDELRLGAKVTLYSDSPSGRQAQTGTMQPAQHPHLIHMPRSGVASVGTMGVPQDGGSEQQQGVCCDSTASNGSGSQTKQGHTTANQSAPNMTADNNLTVELQEDASSIAEEGTKLSLFAQAKSVEEQVKAFQLLLSQNAISLDEQDQGLHNIKESMEKLQQAYRDAKTDHEYRRRQGLTGRDSVFDPNREVEGELYKLGMKIDDVENCVQENLKKKFTRVPFQSPLKADHNILAKAALAPEGTNPWEKSDSEALSPRRPPSVGSIVGVSGDIDRTLHQLHKDYNALMDRYRKLKQMKKTPETDQEINNLLKELKAIFEQTPEHRKPALPPELESLYNPVRGTFMTPDQLQQEQRQREINREQLPSRHQQRSRQSRILDTTSTAVESSDISSPERGRHNQSRSTVDKDSVSSSTRGDRQRRRRLGGRQLPDASSSSYRDSDWSTDHRYHGDSSNQSDLYHQGSQKQPPNTRSSSSKRHLPSKTSSRSSHRDDKDSGYMGSESSRRRTKDTAGIGSNRERSVRHGPVKTSAIRSPNPSYTDSDSASTASTVEEYRTKTTHKTATEKQAINKGGNSSRHHHRTADDSSDVNNRGRHSESEEVSMISGNRGLNRSDVAGHGTTPGVTQGSAFQVTQTRPPLIQPGPIQPAQQVAPLTLPTGGGVTVAAAPRYQYQYPAGVVQAAGMVPVSAGMTAVPRPVQIQYGGMVTQPQAVYSGLSQPQTVLSGYAGVQAARPADHIISDERYVARGRSHSFGGGRPPARAEAQGLARGRHRSTLALAGRLDDETTARDRHDVASSGRTHSGERYDGHRYTDRVWESHADRRSPYDYKRRFEQIREQRYGRQRAPYAGRTSPDDGGRQRKWRYDKLPKDDRYADDYSDYDDVRGYYSDPESPDRYARSRDYYHRRSQSRTPDYYRPDYYDGAEDYPNDYDSGPLDEKYLTSSGMPATGASYGNPAPAYPGGSGRQPAGYSGVGFGAVDMATRGIQNVPQMSTTGVQYVPESMANSTFPDYGRVASGQTDGGTGLMTGLMPGQAAGAMPAGGCAYQIQGLPLGAVPSGQAGEPVVIMTTPGHVTANVANTAGGAGYVPVQLVQGMPGLTNGVTEAVPAMFVGGTTQLGGTAAQLGGANASVLKGSSPKVRYYVREYGAESDTELTSHRRAKSVPKRNIKVYDEDFEDDGKNECLRAALKTAKHLHKMSNKMKETLNQELSRTYRKVLAT